MWMEIVFHRGKKQQKSRCPSGFSFKLFNQERLEYSSVTPRGRYFWNLNNTQIEKTCFMRYNGFSLTSSSTIFIRI